MAKKDNNNQWFAIGPDLWNEAQENGGFITFNGEKIKLAWEEDYFANLKNEIDPILTKAGKGGLSGVLTKIMEKTAKSGDMIPPKPYIEYVVVTGRGTSKPMFYNEFQNKNRAAENIARVVMRLAINQHERAEMMKVVTK